MERHDQWLDSPTILGVRMLHTINLRLGLNMSARVSLERSPFHILGGRRRPSLSKVHNQTVGDGNFVS